MRHHPCAATASRPPPGRTAARSVPAWRRLLDARQGRTGGSALPAARGRAPGAVRHGHMLCALVTLRGVAQPGSRPIVDCGWPLLPRARLPAATDGPARSGSAMNRSIRRSRKPSTMPAGATGTPSARRRAICSSRRTWRPTAPPPATTRCQGWRERWSGSRLWSRATICASVVANSWATVRRLARRPHGILSRRR